MNRIFTSIGFTDFGDFLYSLTRPKESPLLLMFSVISGSVEYIFGLKPFLFTGLCILLVVELVSGLAAAKFKGQKLTSRRMQRFGVMVLVWFTLIMILNAMVDQYKGKAEEHIAYYMHSTMIFYIIGIYIKSILENAEAIWRNKINAKAIIKGLFKWQKDETTDTN